MPDGAPLPSTISKTSFCYKEKVRGLAYLKRVVAAVAFMCCVCTAYAQEEEGIEVITEPPPPPGQLPEASDVEPPIVEEEPLPIEIPSEQPPEKPKEPIGHLRVGGGIGFGFGADITSFGISPQVSYIIKRIVEPGVSVSYQFAKDRFPDPDVTWNTFGTSLFTRLYPIPVLFFLIEGELINTGFRRGDFTSGRNNYGNLLLGGGFLQGVGKGAFVGVSLKVNVFTNPFYPNHFPIISVGGGYAF